MERVDQKAGIHELTGEKGVVGIGKDGFQFESAGRGINDIVESQQSARGELVGLIAIECVDR